MLKMGCCGDDCNICPRYLATKSGDETRLRQIAGIFHMLGWRECLLHLAKLVYPRFTFFNGKPRGNTVLP